jgi:putative Mg2+ transporter-C (MgtC) family protein
MITWQETILRLFIAVILGGAVGMERQRYDWAAGLRTHMLVCLGSALIMIVSAFGFLPMLTTDHVSFDPSRVAAQVVSGIGFLGAGTILFLKREVIKGLTTAAGLWTVAGVGLAVGGGLYFAALATTILVLIILVAIKPYKKRFISKNRQTEIYLKLNRQQISFTALENVLHEQKIIYNNLRLNNTKKENVYAVEIRFEKSVSHNSILQVIESLNNLQGIYEAELRPAL